MTMIIGTFQLSHANTITEINQQQTNTENRLFEQAQNNQHPLEQQPLQTTVNQPLTLPKESPCFMIHQVAIEIAETDKQHFGFLPKKLNKKSTGIKNQCIGSQGLQQIIQYAQTLLIEKGYITSKIIIKPQDLKMGKLVLSVIAGRVNNIYRQKEDKNINIHNAMTIDTGDVLNLRELEQSAENFRFIYPKTTIHIRPSSTMADNKTIGLSDLVVQRQKDSKINGQLIFNNFGNKSTGELQGGIGFTVKEPLLSNDNLYIQYLHTLDGLNNTSTQADNQNFYIGYRYPFRNWQLKLAYNRNRHTQALKGLNHNPIYKGVSQRKNLEISKKLYRTANSQLKGYIGLNHKESRYYIDDLEVLVQKRKTTDYTLGLNYERIQNNHSQLNINVSFNKGIGAFHAQLEPSSLYSNVDSRPLIWQINANYRLPFTVKSHNFGYYLRLDGQYSQDSLSPNNQFTIGDRYAVRGFDGKRLLSGNKGLVIGQEIYFKLPSKNPKQLYFALDKGWVSTNNVTEHNYHQAVGSVIGYRFSTKNINFDAYIGKPIQSNLLSNTTNLGLQMAFVY